MAIKAENWIGEATITEGNGPVSLSGALDGFAPFSVIDDESNVYYTIVDGSSKETGIGTIHGRILTRTVIHATMVNGTYVKNGGPISLSGNAQVYGTVNAHMLQAFNELADKVGTQELTIAAINAVTINGTALTGNIQLNAAGVGARPYNWMPTAADVGADSAGSAASAAQQAETYAKNYTDTTAVSKTDFDAFKTQHKTSNDQHTIAGVTGLQAALDSKYSPTNKPSAADIGADASGSAASAVTAHEAKANAHAIAGVVGLQAALDAKASAAVVRAVTINTGSGAQSVSAAQIGSSILFTIATAVSMPTIASLGGVTGHYRIMAGSNPITLTRIDGTSFIVRGVLVSSITIPAGSDCYVAYSASGVYVYGLATYETIVKSYCLVNALGTGAPNELVSAALPANIALNSRYVLTNPFGVNTPVIVWAEVFYNSKWARTGHSTGYGVSASYVQGEGIILQTGQNSVFGVSNTYGGGHGAASAVVTSAPCRVFIQKLGA